jgi:hypothetical protein
MRRKAGAAQQFEPGWRIQNRRVKVVGIGKSHRNANAIAPPKQVGGRQEVKDKLERETAQGITCTPQL